MSVETRKRRIYDPKIVSVLPYPPSIKQRKEIEHWFHLLSPQDKQFVRDLANEWLEEEIAEEFSVPSWWTPGHNKLCPRAPSVGAY